LNPKKRQQHPHCDCQVNFGTDSDFVREIENMCSSFVTWFLHTSTVDGWSRNGMLPPICWPPRGGNHGLLFWVNYMGSGWNGFGCCSNFAPCTYQNSEVGHFLHVEGRVGDIAVCRGMFRTAGLVKVRYSLQLTQGNSFAFNGYHEVL
jgi:hypothetical protein